MKNMLMTIVALAVMPVSFAQDGRIKDDFRQAVQGAMQEAETAIKAASAIPNGSPVAILPIKGDSDGWLAGQLKIALTRAGKTCVEGKEDPMWGAILKEIEWDERKEDILDPATLDKFGKIKSAQTLMYAFIRSTSLTKRCAFFEVELHATSIATKQHLWGGVFAKRHYFPDPVVEGVVEIPVELRGVMQGKFRDRIVSSIKGSTKLTGVKKLAFLPFAGDTANYVADIVRDAIAKTDLTAVNLDISTIGEARLALRDQPGQADALIYGSLRDMSIVRKDTAPHEKRYTLIVEIQACIERASTREQLWSDTISVAEEYAPDVGWWETVCTYCPAVRSKPWLLVAVPLGLLLLLVLVGKFLKATTRVR